MVNFLPDKLHLWRPLYHQGKATALSTLSATHGTILSGVAKTLKTGTGIEKVLATTGLEPASPGRPWQESNPRLWTSRWPAPSLGPHSQELYHWATRPAIKLGQISRIARPVCNPCRYSRFPNFETSRQNLCWKGPLCLSSHIVDSASRPQKTTFLVSGPEENIIGMSSGKMLCET